jgi:hypothetical protein
MIALIVMLGWDWFGFDEKRARTGYTELVFLHPVGSACHVVDSGASEAQKVDTLFFMPGWARCGFHEKSTRTRYTEVVFLHPIGYAGHVVHTSPSGAQNVDVLFFMLWWAWYCFQNLCFCIRWNRRFT